MPIYTDCIYKLRQAQDLSEEEAHGLAIDLLNGNVSTEDTIELLTLLHKKEETIHEIVGFIHAMRANMKALNFKQTPLIDICGTGGSLENRFNVSTCVALVLGKLGYFVAKHGNRGSKRANGSFDFLDELNIPYELSPEEHQMQLNKTGATFLFARLYHPAVRHVAKARQQLTSRSIFNLIGPFCNPSSPTTQIIGTPSHDLAQKLLQVGQALPYDTFAVISSDIGLDEVSTVGLSTVQVHQRNHSRTFSVNPKDYNIHHSLNDVTVSQQALAKDNAEVFRQIVSNKEIDHPLAQLVALNAAVIMHIQDETMSINDGIQQALQQLIQLTLKN